LQPLDGVAIGAPRVSADVAQDLRTWTAPRFAEPRRQGIELLAQREISGERADQRLVPTLALAARQARQRNQQRVALASPRRAAEDVQAIADLQLLQL